MGQQQVDLALTEAILQDPFNHPMAELIANQHDEDEPNSATLDPSHSLHSHHEEKEADDNDELHDGEAKAASPFIASVGAASPAGERLSVRRPSSAPGRMREAADRNGTMKLFSLFKALTHQIKQEVKEIPAFDEDEYNLQRRQQQQQNKQPDIKETTTTTTTAATTAPPDTTNWQSLYEEMKAKADTAEEGRIYLDGVVADLQRQLTNESDRHMQQLMHCRCTEWEAKHDTLTTQLDDEAGKRQAAEAERDRLVDEMAALKQYQTAQNAIRNGEVKEMRRKANEKEQECKELTTQTRRSTRTHRANERHAARGHTGQAGQGGNGG